MLTTRVTLVLVAALLASVRRGPGAGRAAVHRRQPRRRRIHRQRPARGFQSPGLHGARRFASDGSRCAASAARRRDPGAERPAPNAREAAVAVKRGARRRIPLHAGDSTNARRALLKALARQTRDPASRAADREGVARLRSTLGRMEEDVRTAVELRFLQGAEVTDAAREMGRESGASQWAARRGGAGSSRIKLAPSAPGAGRPGGDRLAVCGGRAVAGSRHAAAARRLWKQPVVSLPAQSLRGPDAEQ